MVAANLEHDEHDAWIPPTGEALAARLFGLVMVGVVAVIAFMVVMGAWGE